jgi:hypothetical protein
VLGIPALNLSSIKVEAYLNTANKFSNQLTQKSFKKILMLALSILWAKLHEK